MSDKECIALLKSGDTQGLSVLIDRYGNYIGKILYSFLGSGLSAQDLEEISSDVFFQLWKQRERLKENENLKGYIVAIAKNMGRKKLRSLKAVCPLPEDFELVSSNSTPQETAELSEQAKWVSTILSFLNSADKEIFYRHYFLEQTTAEIAKVMGINRSTILSRLSRGRSTIKIEFGGVANEYRFRARQKPHIK